MSFLRRATSDRFPMANKRRDAFVRQKDRPVKLEANDNFVRRLVANVGSLIGGETGLRDVVIEQQLELAERQNGAVARYWRSAERGIGIPTAAFRGNSLYHFPEVEPARVFRTSGTSGKTKGVAAYSPMGMMLLDAAILSEARRRLAPETKGQSFACIRLIPASAAVPDVIMAYGMECISKDLGVSTLSDTVFDGLKVDLGRVERLLEKAIAAQIPVLLLGATFGVVNICDALAATNRRFELPEGSQLLDAGGLKNRAREVNAEGYRRLVTETFGSIHSINLFGMTELASQLYDSTPHPFGPKGERVKSGSDWAWPSVREPTSLAKTQNEIGLLEIMDLAIVDRPCVILSDDIALGATQGAAVIGRAIGTPTRGCALHIEEVAGGAS